VLVRHVREARETIIRLRDRSWREQLALMIGSAFAGAAISGFAGEIALGQAHMHLALIIAYPILLAVGLLIGFLGLRR
jgi:hypothetical protein